MRTTEESGYKNMTWIAWKNLTLMEYWMRTDDKKQLTKSDSIQRPPQRTVESERRCDGMKSHAPIFYRRCNKIRLLHNFHPIPFYPQANNSNAPSDDCTHTDTRRFDGRNAATTATTTVRIDFKATVTNTHTRTRNNNNDVDRKRQNK